ncbi:MAG: DNA polymerase I [Candidatus Nanopelagicaceae bacterium]
MKRRILLIDGHSLAYRAFFALPLENFSTTSGQHTNAVYGFASMLLNLIRDEKPTHIAAAFDVSRKTFRTEAFPDYKANRAKTPDEFRSQISYITELLEAFQIKSYECEGFEADDILATIVAKDDGQSEFLICTGDRDAFQLVTENVTVLYPKKGVTELARMTPEAVEEKYGLNPKQYPDFAALRGDPSDNLPSIPGVGEKTAAKWIKEYGSLKKLIERVDEISGKAGESLRESINNVIRNRELTQLRSDVPIQFDIPNLEWSGINIDSSVALFEKLEIKALRDRARSLSGTTKETSTSSIRKIKVEQVDIATLKSRVQSAKGPISLYATTDEILIALDQLTVIKSEYVKENLEIPNGAITHRAKPLIRSSLIKTTVFDTELAAYLINPGTRDLEIEELLNRYIGISFPPANKDLFGGSVNPEIVAYLFDLEGALKEELVKRELEKLFVDLEMPTLHLLAQMERVGIGVDRDELDELHNFFSTAESIASKAAFEAAGQEFNPASPKQLQTVLFDQLKLPKTKRIKTGFSTDAESLEWLFAKTGHPVLQNLLRIREVGKLKTTIEGLLSSIGEDGRIHTTFQQTVAATGRLSSTDPNLQNIPIRTDEGRRIRNAFVAKEPYVDLLTADYSQIEMRIMAHLSQDAGLLKAFHEGEDLHTTVAAQVFSVPAKNVDPEMRRQIKAMSYGLAYGLSSFGLAQQLDIDPGEASALMGRYFERFGGIQDYLKEVVKIARERGYTETILGRRRYLPDLNHENRQRREVAERAALNAPIQGSAADIIKVAMLNVAKALEQQHLESRLLLQVHDELIFEVAPGEHQILEEIVRQEMGRAYPLKAPLDVNVGFGKSWDLAAH